MEDFVHLTSVAGVEAGGLKAASVEDHEFLVANVNGEYFVTDARCPHMGGHLPNGTLESYIITCPRHHSQFDLRDGHVVRWTDWRGAQLSIAELLRHPRPLRTYEVRIDGTEIMVGREKTPPAPQ